MLETWRELFNYGGGLIIDMENSKIVERVSHKNFYSRALELFIEEYIKSIEKKDIFNVALSGGNTPVPLFKLLAKEKIEWDKVHIFMVDERYLPINDPNSNYGNLYENFISKIDIPSKNIKFIKHLESVEDSRETYQYELDEYFKDSKKGFDLIILGMGTDGHTASLFPDSIKLDGDVVPSLESDYHKYSRISLGLTPINNSTKKIFLLTKDKEATLDELYEKSYPASKVTGDIIFLLEN